MSDDRDPPTVPSKIASRESRHLRRTTRRIMSAPMNLVEPPSSLDHRQASTQFQQVHRSHSQPRISGSFEIELSPILEDTPAFGNVTSVLVDDEKVRASAIAPILVSFTQPDRKKRSDQSFNRHLSSSLSRARPLVRFLNVSKCYR